MSWNVLPDKSIYLGTLGHTRLSNVISGKRSVSCGIRWTTGGLEKEVSHVGSKSYPCNELNKDYRHHET